MTDLRRGCHCARLLLAVLLLPAASSADVLDAVNAARRSGCGTRSAALPPLRESARLDAVAQRLSQGEELRIAEQGAGYHAVSSFSVKISGVPPSGDVTNIVARQFCPQLTNPAFLDLGTWRIGTDVWIALAEPFRPPAPQDLAAISDHVLALTNQARSQARRCGTSSFAAAAPLAADATLAKVALAYAREMARYGYMDHTGRDGSSPEERIARGGYRWREAGENLASGIMTAEAVVDGWLASPEHCANLMYPLYREMGVAFAVNPHDEMGVYWAMEFGTPR
ncbi:MAG TPA: CAP domain-containing protein [Steroidobacteraceae bacterium]|nr:CAP domain-containing protein [Steroidobacteraceae bacterium]